MAGYNATMASVFGLLHKKVLGRRRWVTRLELCIAIVTWIERTTIAADISPASDG